VSCDLKNTAKSGINAGGQKEKLKTLRKDIDTVDNQLLELLNKRAALVLEVGKIKKRTEPVPRPGA